MTERGSRVILIRTLIALAATALALSLFLPRQNSSCIEEEKQQQQQHSKEIDDDSFAYRKALVRNVCLKYSDPFRPEQQSLKSLHSHMHDFMFFVKHGNIPSMICSIHKTGSNSWAEFLRGDSFSGEEEMSVDGEQPPAAAAAEVMMVSEECWPGCVKAYSRVMVVRHPLERLLSAWRHVYDREQLSYGLHERLTWTGFVQRVIGVEEELGEGWRETQEAVGSHWEPYWRVCSVCHEDLRPDVVIKLEHLQEDLEKYLNVTSGIASEFPHLVTGPNGHTSGHSKAFYSMLTKTQVMQLYEVYRLDHELFDYSPKEFVDYAEQQE